MKYGLSLIVFVCFLAVTFGQAVPYGNNDQAGKYLTVGNDCPVPVND